MRFPALSFAACATLAVLWQEPAHALEPGLALEQYVHSSWDTRDGLTEGAVLSLRQDQSGYLWLGCQASLTRFDGRDFVVLEPGPGGLAQHSFTRDIIVGTDGALWAGLVGGVVRLSENGHVLLDQANGLTHPFVYALARADQNDLWIGTGGEGIWRLSNGKFTPHPAYTRPARAGEKLPAHINGLVEHNGELWAASNRGVVALDASTAVRTLGTEAGLPSGTVNTLLADHRGTLWAGTTRGLVRLKGERFAAPSFGSSARTATNSNPFPESDTAIPELDVTALFEDQHRNLWVGSRDGQLTRLPDDREKRPDRLDFSRAGAVLALGEDSSGALWVGTSSTLERLSHPGVTSYSSAQGVFDGPILGISPHVDGGFWVLDASRAIRRFSHADVGELVPSESITGEGSLGMVTTNSGALWVGGDRLHRFDSAGHATFDNPGGEFSILVEQKDQLLLTQTDHHGVSTLSTFDGAAFKRLKVDIELKHVQRLLPQGRDILWISTGGGGLVRHNRETGRSKTFDRASGLPHDVVYGLALDKKQQLWVTTRGGLARIQANQVTSLADIRRIPKRSPVHLHIDRFDSLWASADDGIHRMQLKQLDQIADGLLNAARLETKHFGLNEGLRSLQISWRPNGSATEMDGTLWYATERGLAKLAIKPWSAQAPPKSVRLERVLIDGVRTSVAKPIQLPSGRERVELHYNAPGLAEPEQLQFRYQLAGEDEHWVNAGGRKVAYYSRLSAGDYSFRVEARRGNSAWTSAGESAHFVVPPRWQDTWWARCLFALAAALSAWTLYRLRIRQLQGHQQHLLALVDERTVELRREVKERAEVEEQVRALNEHLEQRVGARTKQWELANAALALDITNREQAEAALASEKERLHATLCSVVEGVITTDTNGLITTMNPVAEKLTGWPTTQALGQPLAHVVCVRHYETGAPDEAFTAHLENDSSTVPQRARLRSRGPADGDAKECLIEATMASIGGQTPRGKVLVFRDVTEQARTAELLQRTQKLEGLGVLAGGIAHDFNNLMTGVFGHVDLARSMIDRDSAAAVHLTETMSVLGNARELARQLQTFSSSGTLQTSAHEIKKLLESSTRFVLSGSSVSTAFSIPSDVWLCELDEHQIRQALDNLVLNARQAMPNGGRLKIEAKNVTLAPGEQGLAAGKYVELLLKDEGTGIPSSVRSKVFDPFFTTKAAGTGLGLAMTHSIITQHQGSIEVLSTSEQGTTFRIRLKAATAGACKKQLDPEVAALGKIVHRHRVLAMDDEPAIRSVLKRGLSNYGCEVTVARSGEEAIKLYETASSEGKPFSFVLLDLTVQGGMGGLEAFQHLRRLNPGIIAIASSGYSSDADLDELERNGFAETLPKPYTLQDLEATVAALQLPRS